MRKNKEIIVLNNKIGNNWGLCLLLWLCTAFSVNAGQSPRIIISLNEHWKTVADDQHIHAYDGFERSVYNDASWKTVNIPHSWDQYEGYRRMLAGNRHGYAWYRKPFKIAQEKAGKRFFLFFEGVGSYATVFLNGREVGRHAGGRTTFTLDVTQAILVHGQQNVLSVRADHPANIQDLPWVDGGSATERGFSEGSQPMGIFRPVQLVVTNELRVEPFGLHIWNDTLVNTQSAQIKLSTELKNYGKEDKQLILVSELITKDGRVLKTLRNLVKVHAGARIEFPQQLQVDHPRLWSPDDPYLYTLRSRIFWKNKLMDEVENPYGIRWISWPVGETKHKEQFLINGHPFFINGIAEYEHLLGASHAFSKEQIYSRVMQIKSAGFNAFRDAHQPHNLLYMNYWDKMGILCWTQLAAHIWYDTPAFRNNFKILLREWVKERRNSPSVVLWGLENESTLPEGFARECTAIIREMDPTASEQRKVTTCNGGKGTDWDVPQNWTGTYGGNPLDYGKDMERQVLIGEYGAWRTLDLHTEGPFEQNGVYSEERIAQLLETKIRLAEEAKLHTAGHFFWLFNSHDNPGRVQSGEGLRELDRVGPVNYKGLLTPWEEPLAIYYLYRANYAPNQTSPMAYIVSHTWPDRWLYPGIKDSITVYSNCDEVELFNDLDSLSLGKLKNKGRGTHFQWDQVNVAYNVLYAVGYVDGKPVAKDTLVLSHLPRAPHFSNLYKGAEVIAPEPGYHYLYRVNAGGPDYTDQSGNLWMADRQRTDKGKWGSSSWSAGFPGIPSFFASQRRTFDPIKGTRDWKLFQTFRYGRDKLKFEFPVPDGQYLVELYFTEPWLGAGGGMDCSGWRLFDIAINDIKVSRNLDIWKESGHDGALKKTFKVKVSGGDLRISFPEVKAGQALISAIAIASADALIRPAAASSSIVQGSVQLNTWMDIGETFSALPAALFGAEWMIIQKGQGLSFKLSSDADVYIGTPAGKEENPELTRGYENTGTSVKNNRGEVLTIFKRRYLKGADLTVAPDLHTKLPYLLAVNVANSLAPAYDLKKTVNYPAAQTFSSAKGLRKELLMGKERLQFTQNQGAVLTFKISVGVADTYSLTLKYHNPFSRMLSARIEVLALDGTVMKKPELLQLSPTKEGKWNYINTDTGTMINAGTYIVHILAEDATGLSIDALEVQ